MDNMRLEMYISKFGEPPYLLTTISYDSPFYKELMTNAILRNEPLSPEEIEIEAETRGIQFDVVQPTQQEILEHRMKTLYND